MTRRLIRPCATPRCPHDALDASALCADHHAEHRRAADTRRPTAAQRGYGARWRRTRARYLRTHPTCVQCGQSATDVDHLDGLGPHGPRGHDASNLQSLCHPCHSRRTNREHGGLGRPKTDTRENETA